MLRKVWRLATYGSTAWCVMLFRSLRPPCLACLLSLAVSFVEKSGQLRMRQVATAIGKILDPSYFLNYTLDKQSTNANQALEFSHLNRLQFGVWATKTRTGTPCLSEGMGKPCRKKGTKAAPAALWKSTWNPSCSSCPGIPGGNRKTGTSYPCGARHPESGS